MGGGDLNAKKAWHPNTLKNQERVWKAEQAAAEEKKRMGELERERQLERERAELNKLAKSTLGPPGTTDENRLHWMYEKPDKQVQQEEYLLGKAIDNNHKQAGKSEAEEIPAVARRVVGSSMLSISGDTQVDLARKIREDPLLLVKERERAARAALLNNPVQRAKLTEMLRKDRENKKESKSKKKKKKSKDLDNMLAEKLQALSGHKTIDLASLLASDDSSSESSDEKSKKKNKKNKKKSKRAKDMSEDDSDSESEVEKHVRSKSESKKEVKKLTNPNKKKRADESDDEGYSKKKKRSFSVEKEKGKSRSKAYHSDSNDNDDKTSDDEQLMDNKNARKNKQSKVNWESREKYADNYSSDCRQSKDDRYWSNDRYTNDGRYSKLERKTNENDKHSRDDRTRDSRHKSEDRSKHDRYSKDVRNSRDYYNKEKDRYHRPNMTSSIDRERKTHKHSKLTEAEKAAKLAEMVVAGAEREKQRERRVAEQLVEKDRSETITHSRSSNVVHQLPDSLASRIHSNRHYIQRDQRHMNENFAKR